MSLATPRRLRAIYEFLVLFPPFARWQLPESGRIRFEVFPQADPYGEFTVEGERMCIRVSTALHWTLPTLIVTVAHEMAHLRQHMRGRLPGDMGNAHNAEFHRAARLICQHLGFDGEKF